MTSPRCLDLTRLISRVGRGALTGVDRVELAYLRALVETDGPIFGLVRTWLGHLLLDRGGAESVLARLTGEARWGPVDTLGQLQRRAHPMKRRAEADLRRFAIGRAPRGRLLRMVRRHFPNGATYLNVGHSNLTEESLSAWRQLNGGRVGVLVHDMIPLDFPAFQQDGSVARFEERMRHVARHSDCVICISKATEDRVRHWFSQWGAAPKTVVAPLGTEPLSKSPQTVPVPEPYFVAVGTIEPRKNHALLLDVWEALVTERADPPVLVCAGSRGWKNEDVFARLDAGPRNVVEMAGLSDAELAGLIQGANALLFPTLAEGFGLPPVEALSLGTPVICSDLPVLREVLGKSSIYVKADDMYAWKKQVLLHTGRTEADSKTNTDSPTSFQAPSWSDHFNRVLKVL